MPSAAPHVSVTLPTRGRAQHIAEAVASILACNGTTFELLVIDQSDDRATESALAPLLADTRLRYLRTETRGVCAARNLGADQSRGELLACTDDDCRVSPDWLSQIVRGFEERPEAAVLCGRVVVPSDLANTGYAADYAADLGETTIETMRKGIFGITANLAMRRKAREIVGPFDEALGAGGPLRSGGEPDFFLRVLRHGLRIFDAPDALVTHIGVRTGSAHGALTRKYLFGDGAVCAKHARLRDPWGLDLLEAYLKLWGRMALYNLFHHGRPKGIGAVSALMAGALSSFRFDVDPATRLYRSRK
jgi:glycosyltransferase involved in cell wall biosynthesis